MGAAFLPSFHPALRLILSHGFRPSPMCSTYNFYTNKDILDWPAADRLGCGEDEGPGGTSGRSPPRDPVPYGA